MEGCHAAFPDGIGHSGDRQSAVVAPPLRQRWRKLCLSNRLPLGASKLPTNRLAPEPHRFRAAAGRWPSDASHRLHRLHCCLPAEHRGASVLFPGHTTRLGVAVRPRLARAGPGADLLARCLQPLQVLGIRHGKGQPGTGRDGNSSFTE